MKPKRELTDDERIVWSTVARTIKPLRPRREEILPEPEKLEPIRKEAQPVAPFLPPYIPETSSPRRPGQRNLDRTELEKLVKGRTPIEARLDLHGMVQSEAHALLLRFLRSAHMQGIRSVLVITGKGSARGSDGVLRRVVPDWLATSPFNAIVASHAPADRKHGGSGALYVRLRKAGAA